MAMESPTPGTGMPPASPAPSLGSMLARFGRNEQLVFGGGAAVVIAVLLGALTQEWTFDLMYWLMVLGGIAGIALVYVGADRTFGGYSAKTLLRVTAAIVVGYGLVDFGDLLSSLGDWTAIDLVLTFIEVIGAAAFAYGAWAVSGGRLTDDVMAAARVMSLGLADGLVYVGAAGVVVGWFLLHAIADVFYFDVDSQVVVLAGVLILVVRWLARNPDRGRVPAPPAWSIGGLAAVAVVVGLLWFAKEIGDALEFGDITTYVPMVIFFAALVALAVGAVLGLGGLQAATAGGMGGGTTTGGGMGGGTTTGGGMGGGTTTGGGMGGGTTTGGGGSPSGDASGGSSSGGMAEGGPSGG
jgi:hypothetical protein